MSAPTSYVRLTGEKNWRVYVEQRSTGISWKTVFVEEPVYGVGVVTNSPSITFPYKITGHSVRILRDYPEGG